MMDFQTIAAEYNMDPKAMQTAEPLDGSTLFIFRNNAKEQRVLKQYRLMSVQRKDTLSNILRTVSQNGLTPLVYPDQTGEFVCQIDNRFFTLMEYVKALPLNMPCGRYPLAQTVACLHRTLARLPHKNETSPLAVSPELVHYLLTKYGFERYLFYLEEAGKIVHRLRRQLVHNDLHPGNYFYGIVDQKILILDFESYSVNTLIGDVMFAGYRAHIRTSGEWDEFLKQYTDQNPLTEAEKEYGFMILAADFIKKFAFILKEYEAGNTFFLKDFNRYKRFIDDTIEWIRPNL